MKDLLTYYKRELTELQSLGNVFAKKHPKIAAQLGLNEHAAKDPNISRLIESVALMNARINYKLDDDFSEISEALLSLIFPSYLAPVPPLSILQFDVAPDLATTVRLARDTAIEALQPDSAIARFKTCYAVELSPIEVVSATLMGHIQSAPAVPNLKNTSSVLKISLRCLDKQKTFAELDLNKIRFFLKGATQHTYPLYELLFNHLEMIVLRDPHTADKDNILLSTAHLKQVGFESTEAVLPYDSRTPLGYHVLNEFFAFPEKFLFLDIILPSLKNTNYAHSTLDIYFYLHQSPIELQKHIHAKTFALHCTPIINLFKKTLEPLALTHTQSEYLLYPDIREPECYEIYSIDHIGSTQTSEETKIYLPFYGLQHYGENAKNQSFWYAKRTPLMTSSDEQDMTLSIVDIHFKPDGSENQVLNIQASCFNRHLDTTVLTDPEKTQYQLSEGSAPITKMYCAIPFTSIIRRPSREGIQWQLISHLSSQHLNLATTSGDISGLKELLSLYNFNHSDVGTVMISSLNRLKKKRTLSQMTIQGIASFVHGLEVQIELDKNHFSGNSVFLFASVLEQFITRYASINAFIQLVILHNDGKEILYKSVPRLGQQEVL